MSLATITACSMCGEPVEQYAKTSMDVDGRPWHYWAAEQSIRGSAVCVRCFLEDDAS